MAESSQPRDGFERDRRSGVKDGRLRVGEMVMKTWEDFVKAVTDFAAPRIFLGVNNFEATEGAALPENWDIQELDPVTAKVLYGAAEIENTRDALADVEIYIRQFPFAKSGIPKNRHLRFFVQAHLNEMYILKERLTAYAKMLGRLYRGSPRKEMIATSTTKACELVQECLSGITSIRSAHVHQKRFSDEALSNLAGTELIATHSVEQAMEFKRYFERQYREARKGWVSTIGKNTQAVTKLLDVYAALLYAVPFDQYGVFIDPETDRIA